MATTQVKATVGGVQRVADLLRGLIASRKLLPGEQLRQDELARLTQSGRSTIREALQVLSMERMVTYSRNRGYTVSKFAASEMLQLYELRDFAEKRLLETTSTPAKPDLDYLRELNGNIKQSLEDPQRIIQLNDEFHFALFRLSPLTVLAAEATRWWNMSAAYRALSVITSPNRALIADEHDAIISALESGDKDLLVRIAEDHRHDSLTRMIPTLT